MHHYRLHRDPRSSHQQIVKHVLRLGRQPVLDVGAAHGILGRLAQGSGLALDAIEPNPRWAQEAGSYYRQVYATGVEEAPIADGTYPIIVCGDVLEHTVDPAAVLKRLTRAATDDATFIVSLPNVAHLSARMLLLFGKFPRMDRGILDKTHLHFFTRDTAVELLRQSGLRVVETSPTGVPIDEIWRRGEGKALHRLLVGLQHIAIDVAPGLFAYQWVLLARRAKSDV